MKCHKCEANLTKEDVFCPECGVKIEHEIKEEFNQVKKEHKVKELKLSKKTVLVSSIIIILLILSSIIIFVIPFKYQATQQYIERVPYSAQESYTEKEPYSTTQTYYESEPYQDQECLYRFAKYNYEQSMEWVNNQIKVICTISNFESEALSFQYELYTNDCEGGETDSYGLRTVTIGAGNTIQREALLQARGCFGCWASPLEQIQECSLVTKWREIPKTRTVTEYRDVTKYRTVTKYRDEYKERPIIKLATLFNIWRGNVKYYYAVGE